MTLNYLGRPQYQVGGPNLEGGGGHGKEITSVLSIDEFMRPNTITDMCDIALRQQNYNEIVGLCSAALQTDLADNNSNSALLHRWLGIGRYHLGNTDQAIVCREEASKMLGIPGQQYGITKIMPLFLLKYAYIGLDKQDKVKLINEQIKDSNIIEGMSNQLNDMVPNYYLKRDSTSGIDGIE